MSNMLSRTIDLLLVTKYVNSRLLPMTQFIALRILKNVICVFTSLNYLEPVRLLYIKFIKKYKFHNRWNQCRKPRKLKDVQEKT